MKKINGFTLIEVLVSIAVLGLVITALFNINIAGFRFMAYNQDRVDLQDQARIINNNLERQIRKASNIDVNSNKIILSDGAVEFYVEGSILKVDNNGVVRNITDNVVDGYTFSLEDADEGRVYFYFKLVKDKSTYEIHNRFYPRAK